LEEHVTSNFRVKEYAKQKTSMKQVASSALLKCWLTSSGLHGIISQKIELFGRKYSKESKRMWIVDTELVDIYDVLSLVCNVASCLYLL
jgi:hypothetical protein